MKIYPPLYKTFQLFPSLGILLFILLYVYAANLYPGGSGVDIHSEGFNWLNNYWCDLLSEQAINGLPNPARPFSIVATLILCFSVMIFFLQFSRHLTTNNLPRNTIQYFGPSAMLFALFIFTKYHDIVILLSCVLGFFAVLGISWEIYKSDLKKFKITGLICVFLLAANNYIYYSNQLIQILPLLQKITFVISFVWISSLNYSIHKKLS